MGLRRPPPCPHPSALAQRALIALLKLAAERVFDRLAAHSAEGVSGCEYVAELAGSLLSTLVVLVSRPCNTITEALPELQPAALPSMLTVLASLIYKNT